MINVCMRYFNEEIRRKKANIIEKMAKRTGKKHLVLIRLKIEAKKQNQELVLYAKISAVTVFPAFN